MEQCNCLFRIWFCFISLLILREMSWKADAGGIVPEVQRGALLTQEEGWVPHSSFTFRLECWGASEPLEGSWSPLPLRGTPGPEGGDTGGQAEGGTWPQICRER